MQGRQRMRSFNRLKGKGVITPVSGHYSTVAEEIKLHRINGTHVGPPLLSVVAGLKLLSTCSDPGCYPTGSENRVTAILMVSTKEERPTPLIRSPFVGIVYCNFCGNVVAGRQKDKCCQWQHFLSRRSHQPHSSLPLSGTAEVCND